MSRNTLFIAGLALLLAAGALILQFAIPSSSGVSSAEFNALEDEVRALRQQGAMRVAYLDSEDAFAVFTDAVSDMRQRAAAKQEDFFALAQQLQDGSISREDYDQQLMELRASFLDAQFAVFVTMADIMIASDGFAEIRAELTGLKEQAQPYIDGTKDLLSTARISVMDSAEFDSQYSQLESAYQQLDQLLVSAATVKVLQASEEVAVERGFDLVLNKKNVHVYSNPAAIIDITDLVKAKLSTYL